MIRTIISLHTNVNVSTLRLNFSGVTTFLIVSDLVPSRKYEFSRYNMLNEIGFYRYKGNLPS